MNMCNKWECLGLCLPSDSYMFLYIYTHTQSIPCTSPPECLAISLWWKLKVVCVQIPKHTHFFSLQQHKKEVLRAALNPFGVRSQKVKPNASIWVSESVDIVMVWKCYFLLTFELRFPTGEKQGHGKKIENIIRPLWEHQHIYLGINDTGKLQLVKCNYLFYLIWKHWR